MKGFSASLPNYAATIIRYRDLIVQLVRHDFTARYRGSVLGIFWAVINPILTTLIFLFLFGVVFKARWSSAVTTGPDLIIIALVGLSIHAMFAEAVGAAPSLILSRASYVKKVVFPLEILPIVTLCNLCLNALLMLTIVLLANLLLNHSLSPTVLLLPFVLFPYLLFLMGGILFVSATGVYLRDLGQLISFVVTSALFLSPVFYPLTSVPMPYRILLYLNPLTMIIEQTRAVALFGRYPNWTGMAIYGVVAALFAWLGLWWFQRARKGFADVI